MLPKWLLCVNPVKSAVLALRLSRTKAPSLSISVEGDPIQQVDHHKHLGVIVSSTLSWTAHVDSIISAAAHRIGLLRRFRKRLPSLSIRHIYCRSVRPALEYACTAWSGLSASDSARLERLQRRAASLISGIAPRSDTPHAIILARAGLEPLRARHDAELAVLAYKFIHQLLPDHLLDTFSHWLAKPARSRSLRNSSSIRLPRPHRTALKLSPLYLSFSLWNSLPASTKECTSSRALRSSLLSA